MDCLVTKLKAVVDDNTLPVLGKKDIVLHVNFSKFNSGYKLTNMFAANDIEFIIDKSHLADSSGLQSDSGEYLLPGVYDFTVRTAYNITKMLLPANSENRYGLINDINLDFDSLKYCTELVQICLIGSITEGNLIAIYDCLSLASLELLYSQVKGDFFEFAKYQISKGRSTADIFIGQVKTHNQTFKGTSLLSIVGAGNNSQFRLTWDSTSVSIIKISDSSIVISETL